MDWITNVNIKTMEMLLKNNTEHLQSTLTSVKYIHVEVIVSVILHCKILVTNKFAVLTYVQL